MLKARTGAIDEVWLDAMIYLAAVHNMTSDETLAWKTPFFVRRGYIPDISPLLAFKFYEKVYYMDLDGDEKGGYFLGPADNVGDLMTFRILTDDTEQIIERSTVRSAEHFAEANKHVVFDPAMMDKSKRGG